MLYAFCEYAPPTLFCIDTFNTDCTPAIEARSDYIVPNTIGSLI